MRKSSVHYIELSLGYILNEKKVKCRAPFVVVYLCVKEAYMCLYFQSSESKYKSKSNKIVSVGKQDERAGQG